VLAAKLTPEVRAFAAHLGRAVAESIMCDIRGGRCGTVWPKPEEGKGGPADSKGRWCCTATRDPLRTYRNLLSPQ
jgi:hypothetical protein